MTSASGGVKMHFGMAEVTSAPHLLGMLSMWEGCSREEELQNPPIFLPFPFGTFTIEHQGGIQGWKWPLVESEQLPPLMWSVSITLITNHLITGFPANSN